METYHKIQTLFKRHQDGPNKGKMIRGEWTTPELEYLAGNEWEFTEKVDGTNIRINWGYPAGGRHKIVTFGGRSNNATIPDPLMQHLEDVFTVTAFDDAFPDVPANDITLFGEGYGPKIQGGGKYRDDHSFVLFDVKIGNFWLDRVNVADIAFKLGIDSVPVIGRGTLHDAIDIVSTGVTFNKTGALQRWGSGGLGSKWGNFEAEGLVCRPVVPMFDRAGRRIITKVKAVDFK